MSFNLKAQQSQIGQKLGTSNWVTISQHQINQFGEATLDPDIMHMNPAWAAEHSPYGSTIAFGFQSLGLLTHLLHDIDDYDLADHDLHGGHWINYGFNRVRLPEAVPVNGRVRMHAWLKSMEERQPGQVLRKLDIQLEIEGKDKPAVVAEWLVLWVDDQNQEQ